MNQLNLEQQIGLKEVMNNEECIMKVINDKVKFMWL